MAITPRSFFRNPVLLWAAVLSAATLGTLLYCNAKSCTKSERVVVRHYAPAPATITNVQTPTKVKKVKTVKMDSVKRRCGQKTMTSQAKMNAMQRRVASPTRGWLGVHIQTLNAKRAQYAGVSATSGVLVLDLQDRKPAQNAGFNDYDVVTHFNGVPVRTAGELIRNVSSTAPGSRVPVRVIRGDRPLTLYPTLTNSADF